MSAALAARNIKSILDEYERTCEWYFKTYQKEPTTFCRYNDQLDRFEINITVPCGSSYVESNSFIEGTKLYDTGYIQATKERIFPNLKREIHKRMEEEESKTNAKKKIEEFIKGEGLKAEAIESKKAGGEVLI